VLTPQSPADLAAALYGAAVKKRTITLIGNASKSRMAGPTEPADVEITTAGLRRVLQYEPRDLTISVEAGLPWAEFTRVIAQNGQMVPLDPPFAANATVGGVVAANCNGPRRRLYGTARDMVIGMHFATLEGKLVQSGGMVVKNVAGLDMAKLMIGSFGTLAAIAVVNFKLTPSPEAERSFLLPFATGIDAIAARNRVLASPLQPSALDLLNPAAAATFGGSGWLLALRAGGSREPLDRYESELALIAGRLAVENSECPETFWGEMENFTPQFLERQPDGAVVRVSCTLKDVADVMESFPGLAVARAASGVCYGYFEQAEATAEWFARALGMGWKAVVEFAPEARKRSLELWPSPSGDFEIMQRIKHLFDPSNLLNRGRLYRRI
jgi:glycolate oxidase FAD binding subunit